MQDGPEPDEATRQYAAAYHAHYSQRDLPLAVRLYEELTASHAETSEADYSRMQIQNIVNALIPKNLLMHAHVRLICRHLERGTTTGPVSQHDQ